MTSYVGTTGDDDYTGTEFFDTFDLSQGGHDKAKGLNGYDQFTLGNALDSADRIDGGDGGDSLSLSGNYNLVLKSTTLRSIENISLAGGSTYSLTTHDDTVDLVQSLTITGNTVTKLVFNGKAEWDGNLIVTSGAGDDQLTGGYRADRFMGNAGKDTLVGGGGADQLFGGGDNDILKGGNGADILNGNDGIDTLDGGAGLDTAQIDKFGATQALTFNFSKPGAVTTLVGDGTTVTNVERFIINGGSGADKFTTGDGDDQLNGNGGNDVLKSGAGNDTLNGGDGKDTVDGGKGVDFAYISRGSATADLTFEMQSVKSVTTLVGDGSTFVNIEGFRINGGTGNDKFTTLDGNDQLSGGAGNDILSGGNGFDSLNGDAGDDKLNGGDGADYLNGGQGHDTLNGGKGNDTINVYDSDAGDTIDGGADIDTVNLYYYSATQALTFIVTDPTQVAKVVGMGTSVINTEIFNFTGGSGADTVTTWNNTDSIDGGAGADVLHGAGGNDYMSGGADNDKVYGDDGNDYLTGNGGDDELYGGAGDDTLRDYELSASKDKFDGGDGNDTAYLQRTNATADLKFIFAGVGAINKLEGDGTTITNVENFQLGGGQGNDKFTTGAGFDVLNGGNGNDTLNGMDGQDQLSGGNGNDTMNGGNGDDIIFTAGNGLDTIDGGADQDRAYIDRSYISTQDLTFTFKGVNAVTKLTGDAANEVSVIHVEAFNLWGGVGNDKFTTGDGNDSLNGNGGNDVLNGGIGLDTLSGGDGDDTLNGGDDNDYLDAGSTGVDKLDGGAGMDNAYINRLGATADLTFVMTSTSAVTKMLGDGTTVTNVEQIQIQGGTGNDTFTTLDGNDYLYGFTGNDTLNGGGGMDNLSGGDGNDTINGGDGNDFINGGLGSDTLNGGAGADIFNYQSHYTSFGNETASESTGRWYDTIVGFNTAEDKFDLPTAVTGIDAAIAGGQLSLATLAPDLENAVGAAQLHANHAALFTAASGDLSGKTFLIVDANGEAGYQQGEDFVFLMQGQTGNLTTANFI
ncbi:MAG TPA: calcium-binding protein [Rhizomicrobium sp.]|nr:calcium-binding protein [Rhizomicrobium sp.]